MEAYFQEAVTCYNNGNYDGAGALTFNANGVNQSVDAGNAVQFIVPRKYIYSVSVRANWWDDYYRVKVTVDS